VSAKIYIEGGGDSKDLKTRCREGFRRLLEACGFQGRMPRLVACGGRDAAFDDFLSAHSRAGANDYVALLVDSEALVASVEQPIAHLKQRDGWMIPSDASDAQFLLMTTCMETWIAADRKALREHYGVRLLESALPNVHDLESRDRHAVQDALAHATRDCKNAYQKGERSFQALGQLRPEELRKHLPSFVRCERLLNSHLG
jgi:Domain of unknown function (DUF4276)